MRYLIVLAAAATVAGCGGNGLENVARQQCEEQGQQVEAQLQAAGLNLEEYCACATEGLSASEAVDQEAMAERAQQCISDAMAGQASG